VELERARQPSCEQFSVFTILIAGGIACYQAALSGRAAQRMAESTGRNAQTIAKLIAEHLGEGKPDLPEHMLLVID